jgi:large subunit ribosomal protein L27e
LKYGRIVILLKGRYAGRKAVIINASESGTKDRKYPHCLVAGINRYPRKVNRSMSKARIEQRIKIKPFVKYVNLNHVMPTRYAVASELQLDGVVKLIEQSAGSASDGDVLSNPDFRTTLRKNLKSNFESKYSNLDLNKSNDDKNSRLKFFFRRLKF